MASGPLRKVGSLQVTGAGWDTHSAPPPRSHIRFPLAPSPCAHSHCPEHAWQVPNPNSGGKYSLFALEDVDENGDEDAGGGDDGEYCDDAENRHVDISSQK